MKEKWELNCIPFLFIPVLQISPIYRQHRDSIYRDVNSLAIKSANIAPIFSRFFLAIFPDFLAIFADFITIFADFWRYLPIFGNISRFFQLYCDFFIFFVFFYIFVFFILPIYCRCLPTFSPINPIISFWTLGDIFADMIFVTLVIRASVSMFINMQGIQIEPYGHVLGRPWFLSNSEKIILSRKTRPFFNGLIKKFVNVIRA